MFYLYFIVQYYRHITVELFGMENLLHIFKNKTDIPLTLWENNRYKF